MIYVYVHTESDDGPETVLLELPDGCVIQDAKTLFEMQIRKDCEDWNSDSEKQLEYWKKPPVRYSRVVFMETTAVEEWSAEDFSKREKARLKGIVQNSKENRERQEYERLKKKYEEKNDAS